MKRETTSIKDTLFPWRRRRTPGESGEEVFRALAGDAYGGIAILEGEKVSETNRAFALMFGYEPSEVVGKSLSGFLASEAGDPVRRDGSDGPWEALGLKKDGTVFDVEIREKEARYRGSVVRGIVVLDITERKRVEEIRRQKDLYEGMLTAQSELGEGLIIIDGQRIWYANEAFCEISGYALEELRTMPSFIELVAEDERDPILERRSRRVRGEEVETRYDTALRRKDGERVDIEIAVRMLKAGDDFRYIVIVRDVTGRKRAERRLGQAEARYRALVEQIPAVTYTQDPKAGHHFASLYLSPQAERMLGYTLEEFASDPGLWARLIHPEDRERVLAEDERTDETEAPFSAEYRLLAKDGRTVWVRDEAVLVRDEDSHPLYWQGVLADVTGRKQAEEALKESEQRFRSLVQNSSDIITLLEADGTVRYVSPAIERVLGYGPEERVGLDTFELVHPDDVARARRLFAESLEKPGATSSMGVRMRHRDGTWRYIETIGTNRLDDPGVGAVVLNSRDVTERELTEEKLRESERRYADLLSNTRAYVYRCLNEPGWPNEFASDYALELTGYTPEDLLVGGVTRFGDLIVEEDRQRVWQELQAALERRERFKMGYTIRHRDGQLKHVEEYGQGVYDEEGDVEAIEGLVYDVTELKRTEEKLREAETRYRTLVERIPAVAYIRAVDRTSQSSYVSPQMESMLGYSPEEWTSDPDLWIEILHPEDRERVLAEDRRTNQTGEPFRMEFRQFARDGRVVWIRDEAVLVLDDKGNPSYWLGIQYDITERKRAEEAFRESELRLRTVISNVPVVLFALDLTGVFTLSEGRGLDALGLEPDEILGRSISEVFGDVPQLLEDVDRVLANESFSAVRVVNSRTFEMWYSPVQARTGEVTGVSGVAVDITERKEAEEALRESEERYRLVARATNEVIWDNDLTTGTQLWDGAIEAMFGYSPQEVGTDALWWEERIHPEDRQRVTSTVEGAIEGDGEGWTNEYRFRRADTSYVTVVDRGYVVRDAGGSPVRLVGSMMDVTERRRAEERVRASEAELRALFSAMKDVILVLDSEGRYLRVAPTNPSLLYRPSEQMIGKTLHEVFEGEQADAFLGYIRRALETGRSVETEYSLQIGEKEVWFAGTVSPMREDQVLYIARDVTERKRAEEALRRSEAGLAEAQRMAHLGNWEWDVVTGEVYWSDEVFRIYGFEPRSFVPTLERLLEVVHPDDREALKVAIDGALYRGEPYDFEHRIVRPDGEERVVHRRALVMRDEDGKPIKMVGTAHDITERKRAEEDMKEANRRLEELAILKADFTAMVAHELDTPLAVIRGYADMLATGELDLAEHSRALDRVQTETDLLEALVSDVRAAAAVEREDFVIEPQRVEIGTLLRDAAAFVETLPGNHRLVIGGAADGWVFADPQRIGQVLRNLLSNAAKYSPEGAPIELRTAPGETPGRVRIEVADRGTGIHPDDAARIFEKFGRGRDRTGRKVAGTGLGLYLSRRILQAHGSEMTLDRDPGGGSVFGFELEVAT